MPEGDWTNDPVPGRAEASKPGVALTRAPPGGPALPREPAHPDAS